MYSIITITVPIVIICCINCIFIFLIIFELIKSSSSDIKSSNSLSKRRTNTIIILSCLLFSGITWLPIPLGLISSYNDATGLNWFFSIINGLQGFFIFIHFMLTSKLLFKINRKRSNSYSYSDSSTRSSSKNKTQYEDDDDDKDD
jgi:hypothetical protein